MSASVTIAAGMLPEASAPTMLQSTVSTLVVNGSPDGLRDRRIEKIGSDRRRRMETEQQHE